MSRYRFVAAAGVVFGLSVSGVQAQRTYLESGVTSTNVPGGLAGEWSLRTGVGGVQYQESVSLDPIDSDFNAFMWTVGGDWTYIDRSGYKLRIRGEFWNSGTNDEEWKSSGQLIQKNDLEINGWEFVGEWGWQFTRREDHSVTGWIGAGYRGQQFKRGAFQTFDQNDTRIMGSVDEDFDIAFVDFNLDGHVSVRPKWKVTYLAGVGYAFYNKADNGLFGKVDGDGGVLVHAGIGFEYLLSDAHRVGAGVRYEYQNLDGGQRDAIIQVDGQQVPGVVEWPDNKLTQFWFDVHWIATF